MSRKDRIISSGPFKGKKIEFAPTTGIGRFRQIAEDFMRRIFGYEPEDYLISDESSLFDFRGVDDMGMAEIYKKIEDVYDLDVSEMQSGNLLEIFRRIQEQGSIRLQNQ